MKYIGLDAHISSATFCVTDEDGKILNRSTLALSEKLINNYVERINGPKKLTFEEGPLAQWLCNMLEDKVEKLVVCNPTYNALVYKGVSNDDIDARDLSDLLRFNKLKEVYHPKTKERQEFRELVNLYYKIRKEVARIKNQLKATFRMKGIECEGARIYNEQNRAEWLEKISKNISATSAANSFWRQIEFLNNEKEMVKKQIEKKSNQFKEIKEFRKVAGVGLITAATFSAYIFTPWRFKNRSKLSSYCALSLVENDTGKKINKNEEKKRRKKIKKSLTKEGNKKLKYVLKDAVERACFKSKNNNELKQKYNEYISKGLCETSAKLSTARCLAYKFIGIWKEIERKEINKKTTNA